LRGYGVKRMAAALAPIPPVLLKEILEKDGFVLDRETAYNWTLFKKNAAIPVMNVAKKGKLVSVDVMMGILDQLKMDNARYFELLNQVKN
jgi:hypothetical protein